MIPPRLERIVVDLLHRTEELERKVENRRRKGKITDVDTEKGLARVQIDTDPATGQPVKSPWVPWAEARQGKIKTFFPPSVGEQVELISENGDMTDAYIGSSLPSQDNPRPHTKENEAMVKVEDTTSVLYTKDETVHDTPHSRVNSGKIEFVKSGGAARRGVPLA